MANLSFHDALEQAELLARQALDAGQSNRISCAVSLVRNGQTVQDDAGAWDVASTKTPGKSYRINGSGCGCEDATYRAPQGQCKHVLSVLLSRKVLKLMHTDDTPAVAAPEPAQDATLGAPRATEPAAPWIDPRFLTTVHGKTHIRYAGLLAMAHDKGLISLSAAFISVTPDLALAEAKAIFRDGTEWTEAADATPANVPPQIRPHYARLALTRAKALCLRDALNIGICTLEELAEGE